LLNGLKGFIFLECRIVFAVQLVTCPTTSIKQFGCGFLIQSQTGFAVGVGGAPDDQRTHLLGMTPLVQQKGGSYTIAMLQAS